MAKGFRLVSLRFPGNRNCFEYSSTSPVYWFEGQTVWTDQTPYNSVCIHEIRWPSSFFCGAIPARGTFRGVRATWKSGVDQSPWQIFSRKKLSRFPRSGVASELRQTGREAVRQLAIGVLLNPFRSLPPHEPTQSSVACVILAGHGTTGSRAYGSCGPPPAPQLDSSFARVGFIATTYVRPFVCAESRASKNRTGKIPNIDRLPH